MKRLFTLDYVLKAKKGFKGQNEGIMDDQTQHAISGLQELTAEIVSAYVGHNTVRANELPDMIAAVHSALTGLGKPEPAPEAEKPSPHMPIKKTITPDYLVSLEDRKHYQSLKRHLAKRGLTPQQYREKWGLPHDYPMVAPSYSERRSALARASGLGQKRAEAPPQSESKPKGGRRKKAEAVAA